MKEPVHHRRRVFRDVLAPGASIHGLAGGLAVRIQFEENGDAFEAKAVTFHVPAPIVHVEFDEVDAVESVNHQFVFGRQTGGDSAAGRSPARVEFDDGYQPQCGGLLRFSGQHGRQVAVTRAQADFYESVPTCDLSRR